MRRKKLRVAVLMGGPSSEYEVSLATGRKILAALDPVKYLAQPIIVTKERQWLALQPRASLAYRSGKLRSGKLSLPRRKLLRSRRKLVKKRA